MQRFSVLISHITVRLAKIFARLRCKKSPALQDAARVAGRSVGKGAKGLSGGKKVQINFYHRCKKNVSAFFDDPFWGITFPIYGTLIVSLIHICLIIWRKYL